MKKANRYGYKFNENGVCTNPKVVEIVPPKDRKKWWADRAIIKIAITDKGRYCMGYEWWLSPVSAGGPCSQNSYQTFDSEEDCILAFIGKLEHRVLEMSKQAVRKEYDDNGDEVIIDRTKKYRWLAKALKAKREYYELPKLF